MLSPKLHARARDLRERFLRGQPLSPDCCALLAVILDDLGERVAAMEGQGDAAPPRGQPLAVIQGGLAA